MSEANPMLLSRNILLGAVLASSLSAPALADDVIIDGKHCNDTCQSWLGVKTDRTGKIAVRQVAQPKPVATAPSTEPARTTDLALEPVRALPPPKPTQTSLTADPAQAIPTARPVKIQQATIPPIKSPSATPVPSLVDTSGLGDAAIASTPEATDGAGPPQPSKLVAVRGLIIVQSASEKAANDLEIARLTKEMTRSAVLP